jgi:hypothetical protein
MGALDAAARLAAGFRAFLTGKYLPVACSLSLMMLDDAKQLRTALEAESGMQPGTSRRCTATRKYLRVARAVLNAG